METQTDQDGFPIIGFDGWAHFKDRQIHRIGPNYYEVEMEDRSYETLTREEIIRMPKKSY